MTDRRVDVRHTYDRIATHFASTREYAWPEVEAFVDRAGDGTIGLDLGCGNCRHAELLTARTDRVIGLDISRGLLETGRTRSSNREFAGDLDLVQGDCAQLPIARDTVDLGIYVATLHHLPTREARIASLDELARVLTGGGRALVSVWSTAHDRFAEYGEDGERGEGGDGKTNADSDEDEDVDVDETDGFDTTVEWTLPGGEQVDRFYHIYTPTEFEADLEASGLETERFELSSGNCYADVTPDENRNALKRTPKKGE